MADPRTIQHSSSCSWNVIITPYSLVIIRNLTFYIQQSLLSRLFLHNAIGATDRRAFQTLFIIALLLVL
jgi:hypothetical protein